MKGNYEPDTFTESEVLNCLSNAGLHYKNGNRYIFTQCPLHEDTHPSVQIYKDDWFANCHSGCGRFHISKAFPELRPDRGQNVHSEWSRPDNSIRRNKKMTEHVYKTFDLMEEWKTMPLIPRDHKFKGIPLDILDDLGWRWDEPKNSYFIPYFSRSKTSIPFAQWRHLSGERRFTFLKDAKPTVYGTWNLEPNMKIFVVEGTSDMAVLEYCTVPCVAMPSASSSSLMQSLAVFCVSNAIQLVYAGDNDIAGNKLLESLDEVAPYRVKQPPKKYKDWGEFFEAEGQLAVVDWCNQELAPKIIASVSVFTEEEIKQTMDIFPGSKQLKIVDTPISKEPTGVSTSPF